MSSTETFEPLLQVAATRPCLVRGKHACFGFDTRGGAAVWTCLDHRHVGETYLVVPKSRT